MGLRRLGLWAYKGLCVIDDKRIPLGCARAEILGMERMRWYDVLWLLVPIAGIILFVEVVEGRAR